MTTLRFAHTPRTPEKLTNYVMWQYISDLPEYQQSTVWLVLGERAIPIVSRSIPDRIYLDNVAWKIKNYSE